MNRLIRNRIRCLSCGQVIESKTVHDFVLCLCGKVAVDGGLMYTRRMFPSRKPTEWYEEMSEYVKEMDLGNLQTKREKLRTLKQILDDEN